MAIHISIYNTYLLLFSVGKLSSQLPYGYIYPVTYNHKEAFIQDFLQSASELP